MVDISKHVLLVVITPHLPCGFPDSARHLTSGYLYPAAGYRNGANLNNAGSNGYYWSSSSNSTTNGWNLNVNQSNANQNNNNRNNAFSVRCVPAFTDRLTSFAMKTNNDDTRRLEQEFDRAEQLLEDVFRAYYDARKNKRNTKSQLEFELRLETNLIDLYHDLLDRSYVPGRSVCFIVTRPVRREVFASQFRDRVVHHLLYNYIAPVFEKLFIYDSYSCRKNKGTSFGIDRLEHHMRSCSDNYKHRAWALKLDLRGYFMNIDKQRLYAIVTRALDKYWDRTLPEVDNLSPLSRDREFVDFLLRSIIFKDPTHNAIFRSKEEEWDELPADKTLLNRPPDIGLPIGDLTSQLFSNVYLSVFDEYVKRTLGVKHYGRYVDDFFIIHRSKQYLLDLIPMLDRFLRQELGLRIHPRKIYLQECSKGVPFLGGVVKPHRRYVSNRTVNHFHSAMHHVERNIKADEVDTGELKYYRSVINSYLGYMGNFRSMKIIERSLKNSSIKEKYDISLFYKKVVIPKETEYDTNADI